MICLVNFYKTSFKIKIGQDLFVHEGKFLSLKFGVFCFVVHEIWLHSTHCSEFLHCENPLTLLLQNYSITTSPWPGKLYITQLNNTITHTVCPISLVHFYVATRNTRIVKTSRSYSSFQQFSTTADGTIVQWKDILKSLQKEVFCQTRTYANTLEFFKLQNNHVETILLLQEPIWSAHFECTSNPTRYIISALSYKHK